MKIGLPTVFNQPEQGNTLMTLEFLNRVENELCG